MHGRDQTQELFASLRASAPIHVACDLHRFTLRFLRMTDTSSAAELPDRQPVITALWGWAGVAPFAALAAAAVFADPEAAAFALEKLVSFAAIILTFMGGVHWGLAMKTESPGWHLYTTGIVPSLFAVTAIAVPTHWALPVLITGFVTLLLYDLRLVRQSYAPQWYGRLRIQLTLSVVALLTVTVFAS